MSHLSLSVIAIAKDNEGSFRVPSVAKWLASGTDDDCDDDDNNETTFIIFLMY